MKNKLIFIFVFLPFVCACKNSVETSPVVKSLPIIQQFKVVPSSIDFDQRNELSWSINGAQLVELNGFGKGRLVDYRDVAPQETTTYVLTATNTNGIAFEHTETIL